MIGVAVLAGFTVLTACRDNPLQVENTNQPDVAKVYGAPRDIETIVSKLMQQMYNSQAGSSDNIHDQTITMSFESHSQLGNFGMGTRAAIPRSPIDNSFSNNVNAGNFRDFDFLSRNSRSASNAIIGINKYLEANNSAGSPARDAKAKSFAFFTLGYALGQIALFYDSAAIVTPAVPSDVVPALSGHADVMVAALAMLDSAIAIASSANATNGAGGFPIPADWVADPTGAGWSQARFLQVVRSYKAKYRAGVARTPAERNAVDWNAVVTDATNGITSDFTVAVSTTTGWASSWIRQLATSSGWSQMTPMILGMGDTTGAYANWLKQPLASRTMNFFTNGAQAAEDIGIMRTPDKRFPSGETRAVQVTNSGGASKNGTPAGTVLYFRNRPPGEDTPGEPWGTWVYDNHRNWAINATGGNGNYPLFTVVENDMLAAEGYLRTNRIPQAAALIDKSRLRAGLPSVAGVTTLTQPVPGGNACVPQVPQGPNYNTTACGTIFEAMKWEKRLETAFTGYGQWFIDSRGWGDLPQGTPLEWPVPYQELLARLNKTYYTTTGAAARSNYGW
jgi:hypothetical protein